MVGVDDLIWCLSISVNVRVKIREHSKDKEQQRHESIHYYLKSSPFALWGWGFLGGQLHYCGQEAALTAAKAYIQIVPGTCGCGMCMYWNVEAFAIVCIHCAANPCCDVYCVICINFVEYSLITCPHMHLHTHDMSTSSTHTHTCTFTCIQSHH